jgi:hypothetical protein
LATSAQEPELTQRYVTADPYPWPYNGDLRPENTALIVIDMQPISAESAAMSTGWDTI